MTKATSIWTKISSKARAAEIKRIQKELDAPDSA